MPGEQPTSSDGTISDLESNFFSYYINESYSTVKETCEDIINCFVRKCEELNVTPDKVKATEEAKAGQETKAFSKFCTESTGEGSDDEYIDIQADDSVSRENLEELLKRAATHHYTALLERPVDHNIRLKSATLMRKDYHCEQFSNGGGTVSWNYPYSMIIPVAEILNGKSVEGSGVTNFTMDQYEKYAKNAAIARCRARCPVPVILYKNKFICRSGTLSVRKGAVYEKLIQTIKDEGTSGSILIDIIKSVYDAIANFLTNAAEALVLAVTGVDKLKKADSNLLKFLRVRNICDLMVENRKIHTGMHVGSSEKVNLRIYGDFNCISIPYPGCEFFSEYHKVKVSKDSNEKGKLVFKWEDLTKQDDKSADNVALLELGTIVDKVDQVVQDVNWTKYREWDLFTLTRNYMKLLLRLIDEDNDGGFLIHCISGWDRTPLFISLIRISLWADGLIHKKLDVKQIAFLTLGYDWYLFGHNLVTRLYKSEEIMHFCFNFLLEIQSEEFSLLKDTSENQEARKKRRSNIQELHDLVMPLYNKTVEPIAASLKKDYSKILSALDQFNLSLDLGEDDKPKQKQEESRSDEKKVPV